MRILHFASQWKRLLAAKKICCERSGEQRVVKNGRAREYSLVYLSTGIILPKYTLAVQVDNLLYWSF